MKPAVEKCLGQLIISCQAYADTPWYGPENIKKFVQSAMMGGAKAVRCCWPQDIAAARSLSEDLIIIGIYKDTSENGEPDMDDIFITSNFEAAEKCVQAGADIVAFDCRLTKKRGKDQLLDLLKHFTEAYPEIGVMADCSTYEDAMFADQSGYVDIVSTTLSGLVTHKEEPDVELATRLKKDCKSVINAEGHVWDLRDLENLNTSGADMITIGSAITRPHLIAERFVNHYKKIKQ